MGDLSKIETVALVDFNQLDKELEELGPKVEYIIDHHVDNGMYSETVKEKDIQLIGSATTLVAQRLLEQECCSDLALFLSAPISLDSYNFN
jgi:inorganic pyrophosphatase/exopolyphosphatase